MATKVCSKCGNEKDIDLFVTKKKSPDGHASECKECHNNWNKKKYYEDIELSREKSRKSAKDYYHRDPQRHTDKERERRANNREKQREYDRAHYRKTHPVKEKIDDGIDPKVKQALYKKEYYKNNKEKVQAYKKEYYQKNAEKEKARSKRHKEANKDYYNKKSRENIANNPQAKIAHNLRTRIGAVLSGRSRGGRLHLLVGCSMSFLKGYLEVRFTDGMNWSNYGRGIGKWSLDHIIPLENFDLTNIEEQKKAFHYTNMQPLWCPENSSKNSWYQGKLLRKSKSK